MFPNDSNFNPEYYQWVTRNTCKMMISAKWSNRCERTKVVESAFTHKRSTYFHLEVSIANALRITKDKIA